MYIFNSIKEKAQDVINDYMISNKAKAITAKNSRFEIEETYLAILDMLFDIRFQTDFQLFNSINDIQKLYDKYRSNEIKTDSAFVDNDNNFEMGNHRIRFLLDFATQIRSMVSANDYVSLLNDCVTLMTLHQKVVWDQSSYDDSILQTLGEEVWLNMVTNNPWLVGAIVIRYLPQSFFIGLTIDDTKGSKK